LASGKKSYINYNLYIIFNGVALLRLSVVGVVISVKEMCSEVMFSAPPVEKKGMGYVLNDVS